MRDDNILLCVAFSLWMLLIFLEWNQTYRASHVPTREDDIESKVNILAHAYQNLQYRVDILTTLLQKEAA